MSKKWNRVAFCRLLRFGRKNEGGWTDAEIFWNEETQAYDKGSVPDDNDIDLLMAAPLMYQALEVILNAEANYDENDFDTQDAWSVAFDKARAALQAAKGGDNGVQD